MYKIEQANWPVIFVAEWFDANDVIAVWEHFTGNGKGSVVVGFILAGIFDILTCDICVNRLIKAGLSFWETFQEKIQFYI